MDPEEKEQYVKAGKAVQKATERARSMAEPGVKFLDIAEEVEKVIRDEGLQPAFPVNVSVNDLAAHYTPARDSEEKIQEDHVVKIDIGAHSEGFIADTAVTVNPSGRHQELVDAAEEVLEKALEFVEPGRTVEEFGSYVERQIPEEYEPVRNLTGHYLGKYTQHAGVSIPNVKNASKHEFEVGDAFAIEPFLTTGGGKIKQGRGGNIYKLEKEGNVRGRVERKLLGEIKSFRGLPFTTRWIDGYGGRKKMAMKKLVDAGILHSYPVLKEVNEGLVAQAEHTVVLEEDGKTVTTRP